VLCVVVAAAGARGQDRPTDDPLAYAQARDFTAHRVSVSNPDPNSNDDSKHPIPGEEIVLADLPGARRRHAHLDHDRGATSTRGRGCSDCARTTTASAEASVDAPIGDFFAVGHGFERWSSPR
jgi:hypothetical protein